MLTAPAILANLKKDRQDMEEGVFAQPPASWEEFQRRLGMWISLQRHIDDIERALRANEEN